MGNAIFVNVFLVVLCGLFLCGYLAANFIETRKMLNPLIITIICAIVVYNGYLAWLAWH